MEWVYTLLKICIHIIHNFLFLPSRFLTLMLYFSLFEFSLVCLLVKPATTTKPTPIFNFLTSFTLHTTLFPRISVSYEREFGTAGCTLKHVRRLSTITQLPLCRSEQCVTQKSEFHF